MELKSGGNNISLQSAICLLVLQVHCRDKRKKRRKREREREMCAAHDKSN